MNKQVAEQITKEGIKIEIFNLKEAKNKDKDNPYFVPDDDITICMTDDKGEKTEVIISPEKTKTLIGQDIEPNNAEEKWSNVKVKLNVNQEEQKVYYLHGQRELDFLTFTELMKRGAQKMNFWPTEKRKLVGIALGAVYNETKKIEAPRIIEQKRKEREEREKNVPQKKNIINAIKDFFRD